MATALPVVSTAVGGIPDVIKAADCGFLVPPNDTADLTTSLGRLLGDPALRRECGDRGRELAVSRYSVERMVARYGAVYGPSADCLVATPAT